MEAFRTAIMKKDNGDIDDIKWEIPNTKMLRKEYKEWFKLITIDQKESTEIS